MAIYSCVNDIFHGPCSVCNIDVAHDYKSPNDDLLLDGKKVGEVKYGKAGGAITWIYLCMDHISGKDLS